MSLYQLKIYNVYYSNDIISVRNNKLNPLEFPYIYSNMNDNDL